MGLSLQDRAALLPAAERREWLATLPEYLIEEMRRGEWWWVSRPEQVPPPGNWFVCLALAGRGFGKMIDINEYVPVPWGDTGPGFIQVKDVQPGEWLFDENGKPCQITRVFDIETPEVAYRVHFSDGTFIDACSEHQWVTWEHRDRKAYLRSEYEEDATQFPEDWPNWRPMKRYKSNPPYRDEAGLGPRIRTTQQIRDTLRHGKRGDLNHCIPLAGQLDLPEADLTVDPWLLGYWIGNGAIGAGTIITNGLDEPHVRAQSRAAGYQVSHNYEADSELNRSTFTVLGLITDLKQIGAEKKDIPHEYLWGSIEQRKALLAGLLDSDGHLAEANSTVEFCSKRKDHADAVLHLARSLGQSPRLYEDRARLNGKEFGARYRVYWRPTFNPFWSPRKRASYVAPTAQGLRTRHRMIVNVERIDPVPMRCISVNSPNAMFLVGKAMVPTHNSRSGSEWIVEQVLKHPYDSHGIPTEWLVIAETLSDARTICMEGPAGILRVLERRKIKHRYKMSPRPMILFPDGAKIYTEGADDPDVGRGYNAAGAWLDEICVAKNEPVVTHRGSIPVQDVCVGDTVMTRKGWRRVISSGLTQRNAELVEIRTASGSVRVTPEHRVWADGAWRRAKELRRGSTVATCPPQMKSQSLAMPLRTTTGMESAGTSTRKWVITSTEAGRCYIAVFGSKRTAKSRKATKLITSIVSAGITGSKTWSNFKSLITGDLALNSAPMRPGSRADRNEPAKASRSTGRNGSLDLLSAPNVARPTSALGCVPSSAVRTVEPRQGAEPIKTLVLDVVKVNRADVYDITVEGDDAPEFYAGSGRLLVHNCKWKYPKKSWDEGIMPSLRSDLVGDHPRAFVTTTPKPIDILQEWVKRGDGTVHVIRGSTFDNSANLSQLVLSELRKRYEGTAIGRQELHGEMLEGFEGALFNRLDIENNRLDAMPDDLINTVVGVDPSLTGEDDEMGIVVVARDRDNHMYVLADRSIMGVGRSAALEAWRVVAEWGADKLICETNLGKRWMQQVFNDAYFELVGQGVFEKNTKPPLLGIDTKIGKKTRGEPVAMRNEQGRLHHVGRFPELEDQMATFTSWGTSDSPDRLDALVHACRFLIDGEKKQARISSPQDVLSTTLQSLWAEAGSYRTDF